MGSGHVSTILSEWLVVILIVVSLAIEFFLHRIEHWVNHRHHHLQTVIKTLYRELMILGAVSFCFVLYETKAKPDPDTILSFEFAHVFIFLLAIFYTIVVLCSMFTSLRLSARWKRMEKLDLVKYLHLKDQYARLRFRIHKHRGAYWRRFQWWFPNFFTLWDYWNLHEMMAFHDIRFQFIFYRNLPEHFRFSSFLRKIKSLTFVELVESHWSLNLIFLFIVLGDILRRNVIGNTGQNGGTDVAESGDPGQNGGTDVAESAFIIAAALVLMILAQALAIKIRKIYWELTKNPRIYYEGVEPADVAEEIAAAKTRMVAEREQRRRSRSGDTTAVGNTMIEDSGNDADNEGDLSHHAMESPETEMLSAMHTPRVSKPLGIPNPEDASPILHHSDVKIEIAPENPVDSADDIMSRVPRVNPSADGMGMVNPSIPAMTPSAKDTPELDVQEIAARHSIDYKARKYGSGARADASYDIARRSTERNRAASSIGVQPSPRGAAQDVSVPIEFDEIVVRHSLELSRHPHVDAITRPPPVINRKASVAMAVVEAARRRASENQFGRHSLDSRRPGEGQRPNAKPVPEQIRRIGSPKLLSRLSSRGVSSTDDEARISGSDYGRGSLEGQKHSIELAAAMPRDEMAVRHHGPEDRDVEAGVAGPSPSDNANSARSSSSPRRTPRFRFRLGSKGRHSGDENEWKKDNDDAEADAPALDITIMRNKSHGFMNATILKNLEHQEVAKQTEPQQYHWIVKKLIPRLARVASPVEKLFWFGSHKFFMWCVEFTLFFSTVLLSAASASVFLISIEEKREMSRLNVASICLAVVNLLFVLFRIAGIIKKYIFILHNASLVPESMAIRAIHNVTQKQDSFNEDESSDISGSETEREDGASALERRKTLGRFFRSEAESGNIRGIPASGTTGARASGDGPRRRFNLRRNVLRRRRNRMAAGEQQEGIPDVPEQRPIDRAISPPASTNP